MKHWISVAAVLLATCSVSPAQQIRVRGVGGGIGYTSISLSSGRTSQTLDGFAISAHADLGEITSGIRLYPELLYFHTSKDLGGGVTQSVNDVAISANGHVGIRLQGKFTPYVGAGLGVNFLGNSTETTDQRRGTTKGVTNSETRFGLNLLGGADYTVNSRLKIGGELRYVLASDFNHVIIRATATYALR